MYLDRYAYVMNPVVEGELSVVVQLDMTLFFVGLKIIVIVVVPLYFYSLAYLEIAP